MPCLLFSQWHIVLWRVVGQQLRMEGLDEVGQEELRLHTSQLSVGCVGEIAEDDPACLECLHGGIAFVLLSQSGKGELAVVAAVYLPEVSVYAFGVYCLEV